MSRSQCYKAFILHTVLRGYQSSLKISLIKNHETFADSYINFNRKMSCTFGGEQTECAVKPTTVAVTNELSKNTSICEVESSTVPTGGGPKLCTPGVGAPLLQLSLNYRSLL